MPYTRRLTFFEEILTMKNWIKITALFFITLIATQVEAQTASIESNQTTIDLVADNVQVAEDWFFYSEGEEQLLFIDFENVQLNLSEIILKDKSGKTLLKEDVSHLPVNAIFEIDLEAYDLEDFVVELKSYAKTIRKAVSL